MLATSKLGFSILWLFSEFLNDVPFGFKQNQPAEIFLSGAPLDGTEDIIDGNIKLPMEQIMQ